ncbi:MAG TPA: MFS transporter [Mycobacteriales bacterium]
MSGPLPLRLVRALALDVRPLRTVAFRRLWLGQGVILVGSQMTFVAVPVQVYDITHRSLYVGLTSMVALVPLVVFGLLGGAIADAVDRRILLLVTGAALAVVSAGLWAQALLSGGRNIYLLWALVAVQSALVAINSPARSAVIPRLVSDEQVPAANALNQIVTNTGVVAGPLLAGLIIQHVDLAWTYLVDASSFFVALYTLLRLPPLPPERNGATGRASVLEGLRFLAGRRILLMTFLVDINAMVFGWPRALFPELAKARYGGMSALGWLYAAPALGALAVALFSGWLGRVNRQGLAVLVSVSLWGVAIAAFGITRTLPAAVLALAGAGAADMVSSVFRTSMLQLAAPDAMRGRLQGVFIVVVTGGPRLGDLRAGGVSALSSPTFSLVSGGVACVLGAVLLALAVPAFARYRARGPHPELGAVA